MILTVPWRSWSTKLVYFRLGLLLQYCSGPIGDDTYCTFRENSSELINLSNDKDKMPNHTMLSFYILHYVLFII